MLDKDTAGAEGGKVRKAFQRQWLLNYTGRQNEAEKKSVPSQDSIHTIRKQKKTNFVWVAGKNSNCSQWRVEVGEKLEKKEGGFLIPKTLMFF